MKQRILSFSILLLVSMSVMAQAESNKTIQGPAFDELSISGPVTVELIESNEPMLAASGSYEFVNAVDVIWQRKTLYISYSAVRGEEHAVIRVYAKNVKHVTVDGGAKVVTPKPIYSASLALTVNDECEAKIITYGKIRIVGNGNVSVTSFDHKPVTF